MSGRKLVYMREVTVFRQKHKLRDTEERWFAMIRVYDERNRLHELLKGPLPCQTQEEAEKEAARILGNLFPSRSARGVQGGLCNPR